MCIKRRFASKQTSSYSGTKNYGKMQIRCIVHDIIPTCSHYSLDRKAVWRNWRCVTPAGSVRVQTLRDIGITIIFCRLISNSKAMPSHINTTYNTHNHICIYYYSVCIHAHTLCTALSPRLDRYEWAMRTSVRCWASWPRLQLRPTLPSASTPSARGRKSVGQCVWELRKIDHSG